MSTRSAEILGYIARWALLGVTAIAILVFTASAARATVHLLTVNRSQLVMSDTIWTGQDTFTFHAQGYIEPDPHQWEVPGVILRQPDGTMRLIGLTKDYATLRLTSPKAGINTLDLIPVPYSRDALSQWHVTVLDLQTTETLHMVDSYLLKDISPQQTERIVQLIEKLKANDHVVFVTSGTGYPFAESRQWVQAVHPNPIHVSTHRWGDSTTFPADFMEITGLSQAQQVNFFTGSWISASRSSGVGIQTFVVSTDAPPPLKSPQHIQQFDSLDDLLEHLAWQAQPSSSSDPSVPQE
jgi:hypothetical protein